MYTHNVVLIRVIFIDESELERFIKQLK